MKDIFKAFVALLIVASGFFIGFYFGEEKVKSKISDFQKDSEEN
jgi:hypothetical protein